MPRRTIIFDADGLFLFLDFIFKTMAKGSKKDIRPVEQPKKNPLPQNKPTPPPSPGFSIFSFRTQAIILAIIGFVFYSNTFSNEYAFDDMMAIVNNQYVQQGFAGIPRIASTDAYQSYLEQHNGGNQLSGGRYRPLSLISFAVEQQFLGLPSDEDGINANQGAGRNNAAEEKLIHDMHARHVVNVLLYMLTVIVLLHFLRKIIFPGEPLIAFLAAILFTIHPLHTEVVANVKSRDELFSVLFICLTFIKAFTYRETKKTGDLVMGSVYFLLALLSKEYAATLLILLPLSFYIFGKDTIGKSLRGLLPFLAPFGLYLLLRLTSVTAAGEGADKDIMNYPYLFAAAGQRLATEIMILLRYLKLLLFPYPMSADYSYNQIPYTSFTDPMVWLSILVYAGMTAGMIWGIVKRNFTGFAIAFYLVNIALISNIFFNIGAPMGERLVFHSSIGFVIILAYLLHSGYSKFVAVDTAKKGLAGFVILLTIVCASVTIARNAEWKNNETLFMADVVKSPNSALTNSNAGASCMNMAKKAVDGAGRKEWFVKAVGYFSKTIKINPKHNLAYLNRGLCNYNMGLPANALADWDTVRKNSPGALNLDRYLGIAGKYFFGQGMKYASVKMTDSAIYAFSKSTEALPDLGDAWLNLGSNYLAEGRIAEAKPALEKALKLMPENADAKRLYEEVSRTTGAGKKP